MKFRRKDREDPGSEKRALHAFQVKVHLSGKPTHREFLSISYRLAFRLAAVLPER